MDNQALVIDHPSRLGAGQPSRPTGRHLLTSTDIVDPSTYRRVRTDYMAWMAELKDHRRIRLAPDVVVLFENRETILSQIQEVLLYEGSSPARIQSELEHYACLVPPPGELRATAMIDGGDAVRGRELARQLRRPGAIRLSVDGWTCDSMLACPDDADVDGAVQYLRWRPTPGLGHLMHAAARVVLSLDIDGCPRHSHVNPSLHEQLAQDLLLALLSTSLLRTLSRQPVILDTP